MAKKKSFIAESSKRALRDLQKGETDAVVGLPVIDLKMLSVTTRIIYKHSFRYHCI